MFFRIIEKKSIDNSQHIGLFSPIPYDCLKQIISYFAYSRDIFAFMRSCKSLYDFVNSNNQKRDDVVCNSYFTISFKYPLPKIIKPYVSKIIILYPNKYMKSSEDLEEVFPNLTSVKIHNHGHDSSYSSVLSPNIKSLSYRSDFLDSTLIRPTKFNSLEELRISDQFFFYQKNDFDQKLKRIKLTIFGFDWDDNSNRLELEEITSRNSLDNSLIKLLGKVNPNKIRILQCIRPCSISNIFLPYNVLAVIPSSMEELTLSVEKFENLEILEIGYCEHITDNLLSRFKSFRLRKASFIGCSKLTSIESLNPEKLIELNISKTSISKIGSQFLTLRVLKCSENEAIEKLPNSLTVLFMRKCPFIQNIPPGVRVLDAYCHDSYNPLKLQIQEKKRKRVKLFSLLKENGLMKIEKLYVSQNCINSKYLKSLYSTLVELEMEGIVGYVALHDFAFPNLIKLKISGIYPQYSKLLESVSEHSKNLRVLVYGAISSDLLRVVKKMKNLEEVVFVDGEIDSLKSLKVKRIDISYLKNQEKLVSTVDECVRYLVLGDGMNSKKFILKVLRKKNIVVKGNYIEKRYNRVHYVRFKLGWLRGSLLRNSTKIV